MTSNYNKLMKTRDALSLISKIREAANGVIVSKMAKAGINDLVTSHGDILYALFKRPQMTMAEIADKIGKDKSTVTALVNKLVTLEYVQKNRDTEDNRVIYVSLTDKGLTLEPIFEDISKELMEVFYQGVSEEEKQQLIQVLMKIYSNF